MGRCASIGQSEIGWICGTGSLLVRLKESRLILKFAALLLSQSGVRDTLTLESVGATMDNLNTRILAKIRIPVPPIDHQSAILTFLDREMAKIDRLMEVRLKQVERLHEQRAAIIHHAVTKGLNDRSKMKSSGIEWLGDIPVEWTVQPLWTVSRMTVSNVDKHSITDEQPILLCNYVDVYKNERIDGRISFMKATASIAEMKKFALKTDDVIITKDSESADDIAVPAIVAETVPLLICGYHLAILRVKNGLHAHYLFRLLQTIYLRSYFATRAQGVTRFGLSQNAITRCYVPLPPEAEQDAIVAYIEGETAKLEILIGKYHRELELLAEYRASLISHAVTGKIDVRNFVTPSKPEEVEAA
jgi:type I restriction enzyme S subunit